MAKNSMQKIVLTFILSAILPLTFLLIISNVYTTLLYYNNSRTSFNNILEYQSVTLSNTLDTVGSLIITQYTTSTDVQQIQTSNDSNTLYHSSYRFINALSPYMETLPYHYAIFMYKEDFGILRAGISNKLSISEKLIVSDTLQQLADKERALPSLQNWIIYPDEEHATLAFVSGSKDVYVGIFIFMDAFLSDIRTLFSSDCLISDGENFVTASPNADLESLSKQLQDDRYYLLESAIGQTDLQLVTLLPKSIFYRGMELQYKVLLVLSLLSISIIPLTIFCLKKYLFHPLKKLKHTIQRIHTDIQDIQDLPIPHSSFWEMEEIYEVFKHFIARISDLKIQSYENQIKQQQYHLQYLQLQLKPHFYLNSLKFLYALAVQKDINTMMRFIVCLSEYFEYLVYHVDTLVTIEEELKHTQNYVAMQQLKQNSVVSCNLDIDNTLTTEKVPTLTIQTFVENSLKYAYTGDQTLAIDIRIQEIGDGSDAYLYIQVWDNGPGYPAETLEQFQQNDHHLFKNRHVGLGNLLQRLELLYDNRAYMNISNRFNGGALSEIYIPLSRGGE